MSSTKIRKAIVEGYIQRANAYLDHYYLIVGTPETGSPEFLPGFSRIPVTEECKLLPAPGIYAVSVVLDEYISKGMVLITDEGQAQPQVLVQIFDNREHFTGRNTEILFHKKIHGSVSLTDEKTHVKLGTAKAEINELIY